MEKTYLFHITGMHCKSCAILTDSAVSEVAGVRDVKVSFNNREAKVIADFGELDDNGVLSKLNLVLSPHGYSLSFEKGSHSVSWSDFKKAAPLALLFIIVFIILQKIGVVNFISVTEVGFGTAFIIGVIASVSTCMAVVGGLVLSVSANFAKGGDKIFPQMMFHSGRFLSFIVLGGLTGLLGKTFRLGYLEITYLTLGLALVLILLGVNLLDVFPWAKKLQPTLPSAFGKRVSGLNGVNHFLTPFLIGIATFFLPCGFTQSMQLYTLTTGSFLTGSLLMLSFALGTFPVLALLSFGSLGLLKNGRSGVFYKTAGLVVIFFGLMNLLNGLVALRIIPPFYSF